MSASIAMLAQAKEAKRAAGSEAVRAMEGKTGLEVAVEALAAIAGENDLTSMRSLFRMRRRAEVALSRIRASSESIRILP